MQVWGVSGFNSAPVDCPLVVSVTRQFFFCSENLLRSELRVGKVSIDAELDHMFALQLGRNIPPKLVARHLEYC